MDPAPDAMQFVLAPLRAVPHIEEVSIGHALIADALEFGMTEAVRRYVAIYETK